MPKRVDVSGQTFGRLTVSSMVYEPGRDSRAVCVCQCGGSVIALVYNLRAGNTASCGCLSSEARSARGKRSGPIQGKKNATHGMSKAPTYISWLEARKRCFNHKNTRYPYYGGRGITMCREWAASFAAFLADMGERPAGMTLDRINVDGDYEPGNCRWATWLEQARNKRSTVASASIAAAIRSRREGGEPAKQIAREYGMSAGNVNFIERGITWVEGGK